MIAGRIKNLMRVIHCNKNFGFCPICEGRTLFVEFSSWLRDNYLCLRCNSIPRQRAIIRVIEELFPDYRTLSIHESSPSGPASAKLLRCCPNYVASQFYSEVPSGKFKGGFRCENLEQMSFANETFDLVITQDVLEHVFHPELALTEISRTLKLGGAHVFTVPLYHGRETLIRAAEESGTVTHFNPPEYHGNPVSEEGSLVVREWGEDLLPFIEQTTGAATETYLKKDRKFGIDGEFLEVFVCRKG